LANRQFLSTRYMLAYRIVT